jgi:ribonuclease T1
MLLKSLARAAAATVAALTLGASALAADIALADLPREGRATHALILQGGPFPYPKDGITFGNFEGNLPKQKRGYYREYTVPTPGARNRGARRIVCGAEARQCWYSGDHYQTFQKIKG